MGRKIWEIKNKVYNTEERQRAFSPGDDKRRSYVVEIIIILPISILDIDLIKTSILGSMKV